MAKPSKPSQTEKRSSENRDAIRAKSLANLKPFQPGQSGNPGGRPKKKPITEIYDRLLADPELVPIIEESVRKMITSGRMVGMLQLKEMAERVEGKVTQPVEVELNLSLSERMKKAEERLNGSR